MLKVEIWTILNRKGWKTRLQRWNSSIITRDREVLLCNLELLMMIVNRRNYLRSNDFYQRKPELRIFWCRQRGWLAIFQGKLCFKEWKGTILIFRKRNWMNLWTLLRKECISTWKTILKDKMSLTFLPRNQVIF